MSLQTVKFRRCEQRLKELGKLSCGFEGLLHKRDFFLLGMFLQPKNPQGVVLNGDAQGVAESRGSVYAT